MDFGKLSHALRTSEVSTNDTEVPSLADLSPNILEALIPGYSIISRYAAAYLGLDISLIVTAGLLLLGGFKCAQYVWAALQNIFEAACTSSVYIEEQDDLFDMVMAWLAAHQQSSSRTRKMRARTQRGAGAGAGANGAGTDALYNAATDDALDEHGLFNFARWAARTPPRYEPYYGQQLVWHGGRVFWVRRFRKNDAGAGRVQVSVMSHLPDDDVLQLDCIGRSIAPVKDLLRTIRVWSLTRTAGTTTIRHPATKERIRFGGAWSKTTSRPSRPMDTVILDAAQKAMIVRDMNDFLHPALPEWYARRGIPYRRGYLFHGPPGTGKTSLSFALAGIFGLEIYAMSLQEPTLTDSELMQLFGWLPRRCIVLLEDIDAAGLVREAPDDGKDATGKPRRERQKNDKTGVKANVDANGGDVRKADDGEFTLRDLARELKAVQGPRRGGGGGGHAAGASGQSQPQAGQQGVSLSGVLNAIDGVATHEGRVLIMTTNHPEKLDPALVRPGRVDRKVAFRLAGREQLRELFVRMYAGSEFAGGKARLGVLLGAKDTQVNHVANGAAGSNTDSNARNTANGAVKDPTSAPARAYDDDDDEDESSRGPLAMHELVALAEQFASKIPDDTFTPAEVQNLLMQHKKAPRKTVALIDGWVEETLAEKEAERRAKEGLKDADGDDEEATETEMNEKENAKENGKEVGQPVIQ